MIDALFVLLIAPFVAAGVVYIIVFFADALLGALHEYLAGVR